MHKKVDFHTHSTASHDGGISPDQYRTLLADGVLDCVAITDHGTIRTAQALHDELGQKIIIGEEIMAAEGEVVGLFLSKPVPEGLSAKKTMHLIKEQDGLVYIPHPFETIRKGLSPSLLEELIDMIDIIETCNGRAFIQNRSQQAVVWARLHHIPGAASSDAHGIRGLGRTYTLLSDIPNKETLPHLIKTAKLIVDRPQFVSLLYPSFHRMKKKVLRK